MWQWKFQLSEIQTSNSNIKSDNDDVDDLDDHDNDDDDDVLINDEEKKDIDGDVINVNDDDWKKMIKLIIIFL